jgi:hypothetical protein
MHRQMEEILTGAPPALRRRARSCDGRARLLAAARGGGAGVQCVALTAPKAASRAEYPDVAGLWLDGWCARALRPRCPVPATCARVVLPAAARRRWDKPSHEVWRTEETYALLHRVAPDALVSNNHHRTPFWGEDTQIFEKDAPGENAAGFAHGCSTAPPLPRQMRVAPSPALRGRARRWSHVPSAHRAASAAPSR